MYISTTVILQLVIGTKPEWRKWEEDIDASAPLPRDIYACQLIIPTVDTAKYYYLMNLFVGKDIHEYFVFKFVQT